MPLHDLKCWASLFQLVIEQRKPYEVRINDRDYQVGDALRLWRWHPAKGGGDGVFACVSVTSMTQGLFGLPPEVCVLGFDPTRVHGEFSEALYREAFRTAPVRRD